MHRCCVSRIGFGRGPWRRLNNSGDTIPGARALANLARQGFSGHHYVIMALCSSLAAFVVNAFFSFGRHSKEHSPRTRIEVASPSESYKAALSSSEDLNSEQRRGFPCSFSTFGSLGCHSCFRELVDC